MNDIVTPKHITHRNGLAVVDRKAVVEPPPNLSGPLDPRISDLPRNPSLLRRFVNWMTRARRERQEFERAMRLMAFKVATIADEINILKNALPLGLKAIAQTQQKVELRLQQLQKNHDVLRDALNAHGEVLEANPSLSEALRVKQYESLLAGGMSDAEARERIWPDPTNQVN